MINITVEDLLNLKEEFNKFAETAEQHQFIRLFAIESNMNGLIKRRKEKTNTSMIAKILCQQDSAICFINVYTLLGKPTEEYENYYMELSKKYIELLKEKF